MVCGGDVSRYDVAKKIIELLKLQKGMKELEQMSENESSPKNVTNALFVGSTTELQKLLKDMKKSND
jgi:dTDP-4-dehydrorhamnose reductase